MNVIGFLIIGYVVFFPTYLGGIDLFVGQKILYVSFPCILMLYTACHIRRKLCVDKIAFLLLLCFLVYLWTIVSKLDFIEVRIILAHFRYLIYFFVYLCAFNLGVRMHLGIGYYHSFIRTLSVMLLGFIFLQLIAPSLVMSAGFTNRPLINWLGINIGGPLVWSYAYAFIVVPCVFSMLWLAIRGQLTKRWGAILILLLLTIALSQSKAAYLSYFVLLLIVLSIGVVCGSTRNSLFIFIMMLMFAVSCGIYIYENIDDFGNISRFFDGIYGTGVDESTQTRLKQLSNLHFALENNLMLGYPIIYEVIENAYGYYVYNYGVVGLTLYLILFSLISWKSINVFKYCHFEMQNIKAEAISIGILCMVISVFIFSLGSAPIDGHKTSFFFWSLLGLYFGSVRKIRGETYASRVVSDR